MASRAWASAAAVTVQVFRTTKSAVLAPAAATQPRSRNCRSMAAPSACVARHPNCSTKKVAMNRSRCSSYLTIEQGNAGIRGSPHFTPIRLPYTISPTAMSHSRRNPAALTDPKLSVVIPVYNEKDTIFEILQRVLDTPLRKEIVVVDDCSKDGTREILQNLAELQTNGESQAPSPDGGDPL